mmetsp:Transcript_28718/g.46449  ORF Transcript_28718/g.46449 Transcript_28718/m.46449 type:complete len:369 (-) Transcript_28718:2684-3790(-)
MLDTFNVSFAISLLSSFVPVFAIWDISDDLVSCSAAFTCDFSNPFCVSSKASFTFCDFSDALPFCAFADKLGSFKTCFVSFDFFALVDNLASSDDCFFLSDKVPCKDCCPACCVVFWFNSSVLSWTGVLGEDLLGGGVFSCTLDLALCISAFRASFCRGFSSRNTLFGKGSWSCCVPHGVCFPIDCFLKTKTPTDTSPINTATSMLKLECFLCEQVSNIASLKLISTPNGSTYSAPKCASSVPVKIDAIQSGSTRTEILIVSPGARNISSNCFEFGREKNCWSLISIRCTWILISPTFLSRTLVNTFNSSAEFENGKDDTGISTTSKPSLDLEYNNSNCGSAAKASIDTGSRKVTLFLMKIVSEFTPL